jgi:hypothetical protein
MSVFSKPYPGKLQGVVKHAERFCALLNEAWTGGDEARVWLFGRQEEVELVVRCLVEDWEDGRVDEEGAARSVGAYLRALHIGARGVLEEGAAFACCGDGGAITLPPVDLRAVTRFVPLSALAPVEAAVHASDTIAVSDPEALVAEWLAKSGRG